MQSIPLYNAAAYARISKDDSGSNSIENQIYLIHSYIITKPEIRIASVREDSGFSGVDFSRPSFMEMMKDIEAGAINCVIVKEPYVKQKLKNIFRFPNIMLRYIEYCR